MHFPSYSAFLTHVHIRLIILLVKFSIDLSTLDKILVISTHQPGEIDYKTLFKSVPTNIPITISNASFTGPTKTPNDPLNSHLPHKNTSDTKKKEPDASRDQAEQRAELERTIQNTSALAPQKPPRRTPHDPLNRHPSHKNITKHPEKYKPTNGQNNITNRIVDMEDDWRRNNSEKAGKEKVKKRGSARITESCDSFNNGIMSRREVLNNFQKFVKGEISDTVGMVKHINDRLGFQIDTTMGSRRTDKLENKKKTLKRLK